MKNELEIKLIELSAVAFGQIEALEKTKKEIEKTRALFLYQKELDRRAEELANKNDGGDGDGENKKNEGVEK